MLAHYTVRYNNLYGSYYLGRAEFLFASVAFFCIFCGRALFISLQPSKTESFVPSKIWSFAALTSIGMLTGVFLLVFIGKLRGIRLHVNLLEWNILTAAMIYQCLPFLHNYDYSTTIYAFLIHVENYTKILFRILMALRISYFISAINSYTVRNIKLIFFEKFKDFGSRFFYQKILRNLVFLIWLGYFISIAYLWNTSSENDSIGDSFYSKHR